MDICGTTPEASKMCIRDRVGFNGGVDGDDAEAADHFRAVGYFRGTEHQFVAEEVHIPVTVSYTHLDVYKRQSKNSALALFARPGNISPRTS